MSSTFTQQFRTRVHTMIDELSDEDLARLWNLMAEVYYDTYLLKAIHTAQRSPGDSFTRDEALEFLNHS
ncbi:MAG: hypothetical protein NW220_00195 [Leptolyngbyaceae cyanobacterium bins.349]|nr:hypothetical protein [Leptolyngbyaceae cyanobacterium bins.349]